jgi:hypothetical protein
MMLVRSGTTKYQIPIWDGAGILIAGFWALFAIAIFPSTSEGMRDGWTLIFDLPRCDSWQASPD